MLQVSFSPHGAEVFESITLVQNHVNRVIISVKVHAKWSATIGYRLKLFANSVYILEAVYIRDGTVQLT